MKSIINNVYTIKNVEIDMFKVWQEAQKIKDKVSKLVKSLGLGKRLKQFWRNFKVQIITVGCALLWGATILIFILIV